MRPFLFVALVAASAVLGVTPVADHVLGDSVSIEVPQKADTLWYHASDVALLAKTGRPQLLEFFHPS